MKNMELVELNELELTNVNGGRRRVNAGKVLGALGVVQAVVDFSTGFIDGFMEVARGK